MARSPFNETYTLAGFLECCEKEWQSVSQGGTRVPAWGFGYPPGFMAAIDQIVPRATRDGNGARRAGRAQSAYRTERKPGEAGSLRSSASAASMHASSCVGGRRASGSTISTFPPYKPTRLAKLREESSRNAGRPQTAASRAVIDPGRNASAVTTPSIATRPASGVFAAIPAESVCSHPTLHKSLTEASLLTRQRLEEMRRASAGLLSMDGSRADGAGSKVSYIGRKGASSGGRSQLDQDRRSEIGPVSVVSACSHRSKATASQLEENPSDVGYVQQQKLPSTAEDMCVLDVLRVLRDGSEVSTVNRHDDTPPPERHRGAQSGWWREVTAPPGSNENYLIDQYVMRKHSRRYHTADHLFTSFETVKL